MPVCGFDSLVALYSALHPEYFETLKIIDKSISDYVYGTNNNNENSLLKSTISIFPPATYVIPVVVHVLHEASDSYGFGANISYAQIESQIDALNTAFANAYPSGYNGPWAVNTGIQFCLARNIIPSNSGLNWYNNQGVVENGVMRYEVPYGITNTDVSIAGSQSLVNYTGQGSGNFPFENYLNIWVVNSITGDNPNDVITGYASNPNMPSLPLDGVVIRANVFGDNTVGGNQFLLDPSLQQGKILAHEIGHYLFLFHIFEGGCVGKNDAILGLADRCDLFGDRICDIEPCTTQHVTNCSGSYETCTANYLTGTTTNDMIESFMSYADDDCMNTFTPNQTARMVYTLNNYRNLLWSNTNLGLTGVIGTNSCIAPFLIPDITVDNNVVCAGDAVNFSSLTQAQGNAANQWVWSFSGGTPSTASTPNITVTYSTPGQYTATLTVSVGVTSLTNSVSVFAINCNLDPDFIEQSNWYFGDFCSVSFSTGTAVAQTPSAISSNEACASISDDSGNLLFYTNGITVWNRYHNPMTNLGGVLAGSLNDPSVASSAQGALILPNPDNTQQYYVFTSPDAPVNNLQDYLRYTIIDMDQNSGLGEIVSLNQQVPGPSIYITEQLSAIPHCNGRDYWVIAHGASSGYNNQLLAYLVTPFGILPPVLSPSGFTVPVPGNHANSIQYYGHFDVARNGQLLASHYGNDGILHIYTFNSTNGIFTQQSVINTQAYSGLIYGISFSPNSELLYLIKQGNLIQIDLSNPSLPSVFSNLLSGSVLCLSLQLGPDDRIYIGDYHKPSLGVILFPNNINTLSNPNNCVAIINGGPQLLSGQTQILGLPNMIDAVKPPTTSPSFTTTLQNCSTVEFTVDPCWQMYTATWDFGDGSPTETGNTVIHTYAQSNNYLVTLTLGILGNNLPPVTQTLTINIGPLLITGPTTVCPNEQNGSIYYILSSTGALSNWSVSANGSIINQDNNSVTIIWSGGATGTVNVTSSLTNCILTGSLTVNIYPLFIIPIAPSAPSICIGQSITLTASGAYNYLWSPPISCTAPCSSVTVLPTMTTTYTVAGIDANGCSASNNVVVTIDTYNSNTISLTPTSGSNIQTVCINDPIDAIIYNTTGATGASVTGLPAGVTSNWVADVLTISGTPIESGSFNYTITLIGGCGNVTSTGFINVTPDNTISLTSLQGTDNQTICINTAITDITYSTTGATGATITALPAGVTGNWAANVVTISGTPTESGSFHYTISLIGGCDNITSTGSITVTPTVGTPSTPTPSATTICQGSPPTVYTTFATDATSYNWTVTGAGNTIAGIGITGTVTWDAGFAGIATVSVTANGCNGPSTTAFTIVTVLPTPTASISGTTTICQNDATPNIIFTNPQSFPITLTYNINGGSNQTINVNASTTVTVTAPTTTAGVFDYNLVSVAYQSSPECSNNIIGIATITVRPTPTATISGTNTVCINASDPDITFTNPLVLPVIVTYNINGGANQTVIVNASTTTNKCCSSYGYCRNLYLQFGKCRLSNGSSML